MLIKEAMWLPPVGSSTAYDWAALESILDGEPENSPKVALQHETSYWGGGVGAHFWGADECPVRRPIAAVVEGGRQSWKSVTADSLKQKATEYKRSLYVKKMSKSRWPVSKPVPLDDERQLGAKRAPCKENRAVVCRTPIKGLYMSPLTNDQMHSLLEAVQDDLKGALSGRVCVSGFTATRTGTLLDFYVITSGKGAAASLDACKKALTTKPLALTQALAVYKRTGMHPAASFTTDASRATVECRMRHTVRCDPVEEGGVPGSSGLPEEVLRRSAFAVKGVSKARKSASPASSPSRAPAPAHGVKTSPSAGRTGYSSAKPAARPGSTASRSPASSPSGSPKGTGTVKDRKKALLGSVLKKTQQELTKIEQEVPQVASTYALQQRKEAVSKANAALARQRGQTLEADVSMAKDVLKPPCDWRGAIVRQEGGRKQFENFEIAIVDFNRQTRTMIGRARIQNGKLDTTYQSKTRVLVKDQVLVVEFILDNGAVFKGKLESKGQISGTFKFPNGSGTFKLSRYEAEGE